MAINAFYLHVCSTMLTTQTAVLHAGILFGNPGVYSKNKYKKKGTEEPK